MRQWKLSPMDLAALDKWQSYTEAKEAMFFYTDTADAPWTVIKSNDKKRARLEAMREELAPRGWKAEFHCADLTVPEQIEAVAAGALAAHGLVGVLVNNAGHSIRRSIEHS